MKVPLSWLRELVDIEVDLGELLELMGRNGLEVEGVKTPGAGVEGVRVARVLDVADHPDAEKLVVVTVDDGEGERTVLAGARNMAAGDLVPLAVPGARLPLGVEIGRRELRGMVSDGMLCSPRELEVADDHAGIMVLDGDVAPGTDIHEVLALGDPVIDVAVPVDRGDLHSVHGVARDLAAILDVEPRLAVAGSDERSDGEVPIRIDAADGCSRYVGWVVEGLRPGRSPWWLRRRLEICGIRSLSNVVDITNYVLLERGQPLHAFDLDTLRGPEIIVRWARPGEALRTLDGRDRALEGTDLVIADAERAVALAGVMGGQETEVGPQTTRILLESAAFDPAAVRRTSRRLGLVSEASTRFERAVDPSGSWSAAARSVELLVELAGGADAGARASGKGRPTPASIRVDPRWAAGFLGLEGLPADVQAAL
ncbi:MAG: phenylalanine--tRNA ligase subunit beta, partial [Nitriliruptorales bacterium]